MASSKQVTNVQMPVDPALHPAHVVAIRPDVDGSWVERGDYVLSIETPKGGRNVVASIDGFAEVHVSLLEDLEPGSLLFSVVSVQEEAIYGEDASEVVHEPPASARTRIPPPPPTGRKPNPSKRRRVLPKLYFLFCLALALIWPGVVFMIIGGSRELNLEFGTVAAAFGLALLIPIWIFAKAPFLAGRKRSTIITISTLVAFAAALAAGHYSQPVRAAQQIAVTPFVALIEPYLGPVLKNQYASLIQHVRNQVPTTSLPQAVDTGSPALDPHVGDLIMVGFNFCPRGWAKADGQLLSISAYTALFSLYGTTFGGDGRTTFALPDLRGRAPVHVGQGPGLAANRLGQRAGSETIVMAKGDQRASVGLPHLAIYFCVALEGIYPSRN